jgi:ubiquinone/menaquinone biosynthesis C-methylase UbiE
MDSQAQTLAYAEADFSDSNTLFVNHFTRSFPGLAKTGNMIDLGCGPGDICIRMAYELPAWRLTGLDAGENMLKKAESAIDSAGLGERIQTRHSYLPDEQLADSAFDAVISNSLLHHLPDPLTLWQTINRIGRPGAPVTVMDLRRPDNRQQAESLLNTYADGEPDILREDFYNSLLAAYTPEEIKGQLEQCGLQHLEFTLPSDRHWIVSGTLKS